MTLSSNPPAQRRNAKRTLMHTRTWMIVALLALLVSGPAFAASGIEQRKIDYLIHTVEKLDGAHFIRNGKSYSTGLAIRYIHMRLKTSGSEIATADEFITRYGTRSSHTGTPYLIRFKDGHTEPVATYLRGLLASWRPDDAALSDAAEAPAH